MPEIQTPNSTIYIADHRKDDTLPVLYIHGAGGSRLDWPATLRRMPEANAITLDLPGHGRSAPPGRDTVRDYAQTIIGLLDTLDIPQAIFCGHSMGGAIAQQLALDYTDRTAKIILVGTGAKLSVHPDIINRVRTQPEAVANLLKDWIWADSVSSDVRQNAYDLLIQTPPDVIYGDYLACSRFDVRERLTEITVPTLVIGGTEDRMTKYKFSEYLAEHIPNAQLFTVQGGGHMMALEQPDTVAAALRDWLTA
jgi:pimeloyl-ACP methyl ester carboxylesterase